MSLFEKNILQLLAGGFYLLNKVFLLFSEHAQNRDDAIKARRWRIASWGVYLCGLPAWVIVFVSYHNWIAAAVETSAAPAMLLGLISSIQGKDKKSVRWLDWVARLSLMAIPLGFAYSLYDFGGLNTFSQFLEMVIVLGFLLGVYLLAKERASGYLWYALMHIATAWIMFMQEYHWLFVQQGVSFLLVLNGYRLTLKRKTTDLKL